MHWRDYRLWNFRVKMLNFALHSWRWTFDILIRQAFLLVSKCHWVRWGIFPRLKMIIQYLNAMVLFMLLMEWKEQIANRQRWVTLVTYIFDFWVVQSAAWHCDSNKWRTNFATTGTLSTTDLQPVRAGRLQFKKQTNSNEIRAGKLKHLSQTNTNIKLRCKWYPESANRRLSTLESEAS